MKKIVAIIALTHLSMFQFISTGERVVDRQKKQGRSENISYRDLEGKIFNNDKMLAITDLPWSQTIKNIELTTDIKLTCTSQATGKTIPAPKPVINSTGTYRNYRATHTYDFSTINEPIRCSLTVTIKAYSDDEMVEKDVDGKKTFQRKEKQISTETENFTFYVVPAK
jgi:hypothetical protein